MSWILKVCAASMLLASVTVALAADEKYSEKETHVARGLSERMSTMNRFSRLAMEKSSSEMIKTFARRSIEENEKMGVELVALSKSLGIAGVGGGGMPPGGAAPGGAPPTGAGPQGAPQGAGAPPQGAGSPPGAAGGMGAGGAGPNTYASRYYTQLQGLSGEAFDEMYLLRVLQYQEDLGRTLNDEIRSGFSKELMAWSRSKVEEVEARSQLVQRILYGEQKEVPATGPLKATMPARPAAAQPAAK